MGICTLYIAMSLDGYIAAPGDDLSFLNKVAAPPEDYGYANFMQEVDVMIWGRTTYDLVLGLITDWPFEGKACYVLSESRTGKTDRITYLAPPLKNWVTNMKAKHQGRIYCDGGGGLVQQLLKEHLLEEIIISIIPVIFRRWDTLIPKVADKR
jgi:dihydrofolate reductase